MINLHKTRVIVCTWPDFNIDYRLSAYLFNLGLPTYNLLAAEQRGGVIERRNAIVEHYVLPATKRYEWFLFVDHDQFPFQEGDLLKPFFDDVEADVVGCEYTTSNPKAWLTPDAFHMGMVRIRGRVFEKLEPPWFKFIYNDKHTKVLKCECEFLRERVLEAGFTVTNRGKINHQSEHTWWHKRGE